jgi:hypothetical protein
MKESKKLWFIIIGVVLLIALIIFLLTRAPKREYNKFEFPSTIVVENSTPNRMADTITMVMLNKIMGYDTMNIQIFRIPLIFMESFVAFIVKVNFQEHRYIIYLQNNVDVATMKTVLAHELIHLKQHELGIFETLPENYGYVWKGDTVKYTEVKYEDRPYEIEAYSQGPQLLNKLNKVLYKKK